MKRDSPNCLLLIGNDYTFHHDVPSSTHPSRPVKQQSAAVHAAAPGGSTAAASGWFRYTRHQFRNYVLLRKWLCDLALLNNSCHRALWDGETTAMVPVSLN